MFVLPWYEGIVFILHIFFLFVQYFLFLLEISLWFRRDHFQESAQLPFSSSSYCLPAAFQCIHSAHYMLLLSSNSVGIISKQYLSNMKGRWCFRENPELLSVIIQNVLLWHRLSTFVVPMNTIVLYYHRVKNGKDSGDYSVF